MNWASINGRAINGDVRRGLASSAILRGEAQAGATAQSTIGGLAIVRGAATLQAGAQKSVSAHAAIRASGALSAAAGRGHAAGAVVWGVAELLANATRSAGVSAWMYSGVDLAAMATRGRNGHAHIRGLLVLSADSAINDSAQDLESATFWRSAMVRDFYRPEKFEFVRPA